MTPPIQRLEPRHQRASGIERQETFLCATVPGKDAGTVAQNVGDLYSGHGNCVGRQQGRRLARSSRPQHIGEKEDENHNR